MEQICSWYGISRQAHYQEKKRQKVRQAEGETICSLVRQVRHRHPRLGARKLLMTLEAGLAERGIAIGRDRFIEVLREQELLVPRRRTRRRTTWASDWRCENLLPTVQIQQPNQAWAGDITYIETDEGFCYLALLTDMHSRLIVGFDLSTSLSVEGAQRALDRAVRQQRHLPPGLIHHSDRGIQYTCKSYRRRLKKYKMRSSMGQTGNCYDNALAERVNGILKVEYGLDGRFASIAQAHKAVAQAIWLYNNERPHLSLAYRIPAHVHGPYLRQTRSNSTSIRFPQQRYQAALSVTQTVVRTTIRPRRDGNTFSSSPDFT